MSQTHMRHGINLHRPNTITPVHPAQGEQAYEPHHADGCAWSTLEDGDDGEGGEYYITPMDGD